MFHHQQGQKSDKSNQAQQKQQQTRHTTGLPVNGTHPATLIQRAKLNPNSLSSDEVLRLQQTIGNRATTQLLAGRSGRQVQAKLTIGEPENEYERQADRVAAEVVKQIHAPVSQQAGQGQAVQREEVSGQEKELQLKPMLQLRSAKVGMTAAPEVEASIQQARGGGQPLADSIREPMEQGFGADFSRVKVHTDNRADQLNQSLQAKAFTTGQDVFFRQGEYNPGSRGGQELIAHELTHVVQQSGGAVRRSPLPPQQLPQQTASESSSAKAKEKIPNQTEITAMQAVVPTLQRKISYARGRYKSPEELKSALVTIFGDDAKEKIIELFTNLENMKNSCFSTDAFNRISDAMQLAGYSPNYAVRGVDSTGKHGPKLPDRPTRGEQESRPEAAMSAFNHGSVTLGRITIWYRGEEYSFIDRNENPNVHAEDGLIKQVKDFVAMKKIDTRECKVNLTINNFFCGPETTKKGRGSKNCLDLISELQNHNQFPDFHVYFQNTYGDIKFMDSYIKKLQSQKIKVSSFTTSKDKPQYINAGLDPESTSESESVHEKKKEVGSSGVLEIEPPSDWDGASLPQEAHTAFFRDGIRIFYIGGMKLSITAYSEESGLTYRIRPRGG